MMRTVNLGFIVWVSLAINDCLFFSSSTDDDNTENSNGSNLYLSRYLGREQRLLSCGSSSLGDDDD